MRFLVCGKIKAAKDCKPRLKHMKSIKKANARRTQPLTTQKKVAAGGGGAFQGNSRGFTYWLVNKWNVLGQGIAQTKSAE